MTQKNTGFFYLKIFILFFLLLIISSFIYKVITEITESKFKNNSFYVLYVARDSKYISIDKETRSAVFLSLGDLRKFVKGKGVLASSFSLGLPINAMVIDEHPPRNLQEFSSTKNMMRLIFDTTPILKNMNRYDIYKMINAINYSLEDNRQELRVNLFDQNDMKKKVGDSLKDSVISNIQYTIQINNGTNLNGLGSELATILGKVGFNIIAVRTSQEKGNSYIAFPGESDKFISSLKGLFGSEIKRAKVAPASDVTIFIGEDIEALLSD